VEKNVASKEIKLIHPLNMKNEFAIFSQSCADLPEGEEKFYGGII
jgi:hypothetical protein